MEQAVRMSGSGTVQLASALLLGLFFAFVYRQKRQPYLLVWSSGWMAVSLYLLGALAGPRVGEPRWFEALDAWLLTAAALVFYCAARLYTRQKLAVWGVAAIAGAAAAWSFAREYGGLAVPMALGTGLVFVAVAAAFMQEGREQESRADTLLAITFATWGVLCFAMAFQKGLPRFARLELPPLMFLPMLFAGVLTVMGVYEEERRRVERNMLALSNLNLATSRFTGGEIQKMLGQALDRVLNVARIPAGALCMSFGESRGPTSVVATGLGEGFCSDIQEAQLDEYVVSLVARLGGLVVLRDIASDETWEALEKEEQFRHLRYLLLRRELRTVVGISVQAKERVLGVLLLATPDHRNFTPAELRLLLALGQQIGMAVENSFLIQQTSRRSEELHMLIEIGRALSSTLELDELLERIYREMRRILDVNCFYIATYDPKAGKVQYEIEMTDGERIPKRERAAGNHMVEHVVRTGQPLLIRENFQEETKRMGFESLTAHGSVCAVPLILHDRTVGVVAAHSARERMFDEGHAELLRVLASETGIAIENARLFAEEQKRSRHLELINNVSRHAITTLDPDAMLAKIVSEIEKGVAYDHIGVAILDYPAKELVVQTEAGARREALGRRIALGEGLVGQVARTGQMGIVREANAASPAPVLDGSVSAIALPVLYTEQLLGVFYLESTEPRDFPGPEILLLRTLADLFAGALHNAMSFQKAQEQAITDGLTGVKTHRFLMESLSSEWKRSTRANREFALVLMDLDHFKFVNDFHGHLEGDAVLQRVGLILEQNCRRSDVVARYGGDEFVILMPETSVEQARQLASKLRGWISSDTVLREKNMTASFGIAAFPVHGSTPQELIQVADSAMYVSKHHGGNSVSIAEQGDSSDRKQWKRDVLEAYLGVTLKRQFSTGPQAFEEIHRRLEQFTRSLDEQGADGAGHLLSPAIVETVTSLAFAIDAKNHYTEGHSRKVSTYAVMIAEALGMNQAEIEEIRLAGLLHDIGKVGIPEAILNKAAPLDATEWETMKTHTDLGAKILEPLVAMARIREMIRHHHEFYDGTGYPNRLEGEQIPHGARVIAIADAYDTITSDRIYKKARTPEDAFAELERCAANQFDPEIVRAFIEMIRRAPRPTVESGASASSHRNTSTSALYE